MVFVAKYAKVFPSTGTHLPFSLAVSGWTLAFPPQGNVGNFWPFGTPPHVTRRILHVKNTLVGLARSHGNNALLDNIHGFGKSLDILSSRRQPFPAPTAEGQRNSKKIYHCKCGFPKDTCGRLGASQGNLTVARLWYVYRRGSVCSETITDSRTNDTKPK